MEPLADLAAAESGQAQEGGLLSPDSTAQPGDTLPPDGSTPMNNDRPLAFHERLVALCHDGDIRRYAIRLAPNRDIAEDALQETYYAVARVSNPAGICDLPSYFRRALRNQVMRLTEQAGPPSSGDIDAVLAATDGGRRPPVRNSPCEDRGVRTAQAATWMAALHDEKIAASVPGRSGDPRRYQSMIAATARWILHALLEGDVSPADTNDALTNQHPEWFAARRLSADTYHKRLSRARRDIADLLACVVGRDELLP
jgi:DNA-directed RNA polymerase specialized sigma24 family protein